MENKNEAIHVITLGFCAASLVHLGVSGPAALRGPPDAALSIRESFTCFQFQYFSPFLIVFVVQPNLQCAVTLNSQKADSFSVYQTASYSLEL